MLSHMKAIQSYVLSMTHTSRNFTNLKPNFRTREYCWSNREQMNHPSETSNSKNKTKIHVLFCYKKI